MKLEAEVLAPFAAEEGARAVDRMARLLMAYFPDARAVGLPALRPGVAEQLARARAHGLAAEAHAAQYVIAAWLLGRDFDARFPEAARVLLPPGAYPPAVGAAWLRAWVPAVLDGLEED